MKRSLPNKVNKLKVGHRCQGDKRSRFSEVWDVEEGCLDDDLGYQFYLYSILIIIIIIHPLSHINYFAIPRSPSTIPDSSKSPVGTGSVPISTSPVAAEGT